MSIPERILQKMKEREFRKFEFEIRAFNEGEKEELYVEGYAARFNSPTVLWEYEGIKYKEQVDDRAFDEADMSDVIFNYNHSGKVMARTRNKTLQLSTDANGLFIRAQAVRGNKGRLH
jgi:uncharacterized protein